MGNVIIGTTMSLDGFMNDRNKAISRLYPDLEELHRTEMLQEEIQMTGAAVMGRRTYDMFEGDVTDYEFQVPIFVLTHAVPEKAVKGENDKLTLTFITDGIERAIEKAKAAAGDKDVIVIAGANTAQQCLRAGLVDDQAPAIPPSASRVRLIGQLERGAFMRTPKTNCDIKSVDLAYNLLHNAIKTARMCRVKKGSAMAKLVFGMNQSLDGYVDHMAFAPSPTLFRHFIKEAQGQAGSVYGRQMYEVMRYWDDDHPEWDAEEHAFAAAWRNQPKWVVSRSLKSVGPNARLVEGDLERAIRELKAERDGEIEVAGPDLAQSLTELGLIDEYRIYLHPVVLGHGKPYFAGPRPPLRLMTNDRIGEDVIRLSYVPA